VGRHILWKSSGVNAILRNSSKARKKGKSSTRRWGQILKGIAQYNTVCYGRQLQSKS